MDRLLARQLKRLRLDAATPPSVAQWEALLAHITAGYQQAEQDRQLLERSLELTSEELLDRNRRLERDIEIRKQAEARLRQTLSLHEATLEATEDGILVVDLEGRVTASNTRFLDMWRIPRDLARNDDDDVFLSIGVPQTKDPEAFLRRVREIYSTPAATTADEIEFADGRVFERESHPQSLGGTIVGRVWAFRDVTASRQAAETLRRTQEHLASVIANAPLILFATDTAGRITLAEGRALAALDLKPGEMVGRDVRQLYGHNPDVVRNLDRALAGEAFTARVEEAGLVFETSYTPTFAADGSVTGMVGIANDITERASLEREAEEHRERMNRSARLAALGTLVAGVAHEINNPLMYIQGHLDLIAHALRSEEPDPRRARFTTGIEQARKGTARIADITRSLKVVARGPSGTKTRLDLRTVTDGVASLLRAGLPSGVQLTSHSPAEATWVRANADELHQVLLNLVQNAIHAVPPENGQVAVRIEPSDADVLLEVEDNGPGIPVEIQAQLFTPFFTTKSEGTGLGLSIAHAIVRDHGGEITFHCGPHGGTTFRIRLPMLVEPPEPTAAVSARE